MQALLSYSQNISVLPTLFCHKSKTWHCSGYYEKNGLLAKSNTLSELGHADFCYSCKGGLNCKFFIIKKNIFPQVLLCIYLYIYIYFVYKPLHSYKC